MEEIKIDWNNPGPPDEFQKKLTGRFGVYDTKDNCWLGDENGPKVFENYLVARVASQVYAMQSFGTDLVCRYKAMPIPEGINKKKDEVPTKMDTLQALTRLENGG